MNDVTFRIPGEHVQEVSRVLRSNLETIENRETRQWLQNEIRNLDTSGGGDRLKTEEDRTIRR